MERAIAIAQRYSEAHPTDADGSTVLGLAYMRAGEVERALEAFEQALRMSRANESELVFNRAVCLFELGRFDAAEHAFDEVAAWAQPPLATLAAINAGFAASERGASARAQVHLLRARTLDAERAFEPQIAELANEVAAISAKAASARAPSASRALEPQAARSHYEAGVRAYERSAWQEAKREFHAARALGLDRDRTSAATTYLDLISGGLRRMGRGVLFSSSLSGGYNGNVTQTGLGDSNAALALQHVSIAGGYLRGAMSAGYGLAPSESTFLRIDYGARQLAYWQEALDVFNAQDHDLVLSGELRVSPLIRLSLATLASMSFMGLRDFRALGLSGGGEVDLGFDYGGGSSSDLRFSALRTHVFDADYAYFEGSRLELGLAHVYRRRGLSAGGEGSYRYERLGTQVAQLPPPAAPCLGPVQACKVEYEIPLAYRGPSLAVWLSLRINAWLRATIRVRADVRMHRTPARIVVSRSIELPGLGGRTERTLRTQEDLRLSAFASLSARIHGPLEIEISYALLKGFSNMDPSLGSDHAMDYANLNFMRHLAEVAFVATF